MDYPAGCAGSIRNTLDSLSPVAIGEDEALKMRKQRVFVTGSCGLIGSEICQYFYRHGFRIAGLDNNQRASFFGPEGDTSWVLRLLQESVDGYTHFKIDIGNRPAILSLVEELRPAAIIHTAAQPPHDLAVGIPFEDFERNASGTLNCLRLHGVRVQKLLSCTSQMQHRRPRIQDIWIQREAVARQYSLRGCFRAHIRVLPTAPKWRSVQPRWWKGEFMLNFGSRPNDGGDHRQATALYIHRTKPERRSHLLL